jgi:multidrug resistance efflux pump
MFRQSFVVAAMVAGLLGPAGGLASSRELATVVVQSPGADESASFDGVVEAVRQTVVAAQVTGAVVAVEVKAGDVVRQARCMARIDARAASRTSPRATRRCNPRAPRSKCGQGVRPPEQLFEKNYTSRAALEACRAQFKATEAQCRRNWLRRVRHVRNPGFFVVKAPYGGVISDVPITLGDMAMPGRALAHHLRSRRHTGYRGGSANGYRPDRLGQAGENPGPPVPPRAASGLHLPTCSCCPRRMRLPTRPRSGSTCRRQPAT